MIKGHGHEHTKEVVAEAFNSQASASSGSIGWLEYIDAYGACEGKFAADWKT